MQLAEYWKQVEGGVLCELCPHACRIHEGQAGRCGVRRNLQGALEASAYGWVSAQAMDPVEKKPLFHFKPGREIFSIGSGGCNFRCSFCQNWTISQTVPPMSRLAPGQVAETARRLGACGVAYTYNEPLVNFEYVRDCAEAVKRAGLLNVLVTNGYVNTLPRRALLPLVDAWNIDLKSIRPEFYRKFCGAELEPVLETIREVAGQAHVELTYLIVTDGNDSESDLSAWVDWVAALSPEIPVHFSRYFPQYQWEAPPTSQQVLESAFHLGQKKLAWVYAGNVLGRDDSTYCPDCGFRLIPRQGFSVGTVKVEQGRCPQCTRRVPGIF